MLCFKGAPDPTGLARQEIETEVEETLFNQLADLIGKPLIAKERRSYALSGGLTLEVNEVDRGQPGQFFYAEIEYPTAEAARSWTPSADGLTAYLADEVTGPARREHGRILAAHPWRCCAGRDGMKQLKPLLQRRYWCCGCCLRPN